MIEMLKSLAGFFTSIIDFVVSLFEMLIALLLLIPKGLTFIIGLIGYLPPFVRVIVIVSVSVSALLMVINHGGD